MSEQLARLTPREHAVREALANGQTARDIGRNHGVAEGTVRTQVKSILRKLQVASQLAAVVSYWAA